MTPSSSSRTTHARAILGPELFSRLVNVRILLVGAGGIGCELLKNVVLTGFGHISLLDLDTIDISNLNRQFLFRKKDVKQSKAMVAARTAKQFNPSVNIEPIHANIKEPQYDVAWFRSFDIVLNALDNLDARRHVNKMCLAAGVPLVESGTAGYLGQVQPILKGLTECFDCMPKPTPKTFPVCTLRSTPSQPIHCIVWAKSYLIPQLFGEDEDSSELDDAEKQGENAQEINTLRKEAAAFTAVRNRLRGISTATATSNGSSHPEQSSAARMVFDKVFWSDINNLLSMSDMWRTRTPPVPLEFEPILNRTFFLPNRAPPDANANAKPASKTKATRINGSSNGKSTNGTARARDKGGLKDQKELTLRDNLELFVSSVDRLASRLRNGEEIISFDKDDDDTLDFVTAAANLRASAYGIPTKTRWEVKEMAGNIIPAIATTNAVIAGGIVLQALRLLRKDYKRLRNIHLQVKAEVPLSSSTVGGPLPECGVCKDTYVELLCDPSRVTLREAIDALLGEGDGNGTGPRDVAAYEDKRILSDPDFEDNLDRTLTSLNVTRGKFLTLVDEDGDWGNLAAAIGVLPENYPADGPAYLVYPSLPLPRKVTKPKPAPPSPPRTPPKRSLELDSDELPPAKRARTNGGMPDINLASPSKKQRLDDEGLILVEHPNEKIDDEPELIVLD